MSRIKEFKNQLFDVLKKLSLKIQQHKAIAISVLVGLGIAILILFNIGLIQISYYTVVGQPSNIANVLSSDVRDERKQNKLHFNIGVDYLLKDMSVSSQEFFETYFLYFNEDLKEKIVHTYNANGEYFSSHVPIVESIAKGSETPAMRVYINRLEMDELEIALTDYFGQELVLSQDVIIELNNVLTRHQQKLSMNRFSVDIYELMKFPGIEDQESVAFKLLDQIDPEAAHENLFTTLKTESIDIEELNKWVDVLNKKRIISTEEYAKFTSNYTTINQLKDEYRQLEHQEIDLINVQQKIEAQTDEYEYRLETLTSEISELEKQLAENNSEMRTLTDYSIIDLYIMDYYENGEYEASIPEKSWFFNEYKPGRQRVRLKLTETESMSQGVHSFEVYYEGEDSSGNAIYRQVSNEDKLRIEALRIIEDEIQEELGLKKEEKNRLEEEVARIKSANNYDQNNLLLLDVVAKKDNVHIKLNEQKIEIQNLFMISEVIIELN